MPEYDIITHINYIQCTTGRTPWQTERYMKSTVWFKLSFLLCRWLHDRSCLKDNMSKSRNKDMRYEYFCGIKNVSEETDGQTRTSHTRTTSQTSSHFLVRADKDRRPMLRQMKRCRMSLEDPKSLQWLNYTFTQPLAEDTRPRHLVTSDWLWRKQSCDASQGPTPKPVTH